MAAPLGRQVNGARNARQDQRHWAGALALRDYSALICIFLCFTRRPAVQSQGSGCVAPVRCNLGIVREGKSCSITASLPRAAKTVI